MIKHLLLVKITALFISIIASISYLFYTPDTDEPCSRENLDTSLTENNFYILDNNFSSAMENIVEPFINDMKSEGYLKNNEGIKLHYCFMKNENPKGNIVISHGFTEFMDVYYEMMYYYFKEGYSVFILEHRGHGFSGREVNDKSLVYVDSYDDYVNDFKLFMDKIVVPNSNNENLYLYAHSMGGCIGTLFLEKYPKLFKAAVLSTPMLSINTGNYKKNASKMMAAFMNITGKGNEYVFGHSAFTDEYAYESSSSSSEPRYDYVFNKRIYNEKYQTYAGCFKWLSESFKASNEATKDENLDKIKIPVLLFEAENDSLVSSYGLNKFASQVENCNFIYVKDSKHQIFSTPDNIRIPYYNTIFNFLSNNK